MKRAVSFLITVGLVLSASMSSFGTEAQTEPVTDAAAVSEAAADETAGGGETEAGDEAAGAEGTAAEDEAAGTEEAAAEDEAAAGEDGTPGYDPGQEYVSLIDAPEPVATSHSAMINGQQLDYTAEVGRLVFSIDGAECEMTYTAYTRDDVEDKSTRPVTFAYNGGPGAGSTCVNLLFIGPRMLELDEEGYSVSLPSKLVDNENSLLDLTDLVIIDAIGTGYSRPLKGTDIDAFCGYDADCGTTAGFIWLYVNNKKLWSSPKYLLGESYGTIRSMGVCEYLYDAYSMPLNGLIQVSSVHDYSALRLNLDNDSAYCRFLPTYAADAWYHGRLSETYENMGIKEYLDEVCLFADTEYISALNRGDTLTDEEYDAIAEKVSGYTGLDADYLRIQNLRVDPSDFCTELLKDQKQVVGRMDGRIAGPIMSGGGDNDASFKDVIQALGSVTDQYYNDELGYHSDIPYNQINYTVNSKWIFPGDPINVFDQKATIYNNISNNKYLKVWVVCGYYDLATPFHGAEWIYDHLYLNEDCKNRVQFTYYEGGHMFYLDREDHAQFHKDAEAWFNS